METAYDVLYMRLTGCCFSLIHFALSGLMNSGFIKSWTLCKVRQGVRMILPGWFHNLADGFLLKKFRLNSFTCLRKPVALHLKTLMKPLDQAQGFLFSLFILRCQHELSFLSWLIIVKLILFCSFWRTCKLLYTCSNSHRQCQHDSRKQEH